MALYDDKGAEEITGKLEGFVRFFCDKTEREFDREYFKKVLIEIYDQKKRQLIVQSYGAETINTLKRLVDSLDEFLPAPEIEPIKIVEEVAAEILPRKRKPKNG